MKELIMNKQLFNYWYVGLPPRAPRLINNKTLPLWGPQIPQMYVAGGGYMRPTSRQNCNADTVAVAGKGVTPPVAGNGVTSSAWGPDAAVGGGPPRLTEPLLLHKWMVPVGAAR